MGPLKYLYPKPLQFCFLKFQELRKELTEKPSNKDMPFDIIHLTLFPSQHIVLYGDALDSMRPAL